MKKTYNEETKNTQQRPSPVLEPHAEGRSEYLTPPREAKQDSTANRKPEKSIKHLHVRMRHKHHPRSELPLPSLSLCTSYRTKRRKLILPNLSFFLARLLSETQLQRELQI
jgi:hypothetical protein